ncbi:molybdopterin molybdotransferase MoeA [Amylibacter sp. SFDW26]|uniref:molybdopterin molybdotransferase MoeA n=1 Tax=Amylibacter sp. SFDW26 TaxID=2652722 RepID=UPI0012618480|nr:gephyrin-like molybdotransferase Glp [Amylibacter sp. SFDW26]KAB7615683.1 molybdopterin molybdotransferase MoeA [Amylibacter sp. SFDW26]
MITVEEALTKVLDLFSPLDVEIVPIAEAGGRVLAQDVAATHNQPPFASSAMDGYAVMADDIQKGATLNVIGESAAGSRFDGDIKSGEAVRIFTGAPVPPSADKILIQEDCTRDGDTITVSDSTDTAAYIRPAGGDFVIGDALSAPLYLGPNEISLLAAMNIHDIPVHRKPIIALVATGDELVYPGSPLGPDNIVSSNNFGLKAMVESTGAEARILPIARDNEAALRTVLDLCEGADVIVTLGGASVGDHDLIGKMAQGSDMDTSFYKVAMRPGKPLMAGQYNGTPLIGLPGNPVSSIVCGHVFLRPAINAMLGLEAKALARETVTLGQDIGKNGPRTHYMRANLELVNGVQTCTPFDRQDSSLLSVLAKANCLMIRPPNEPKKKEGDIVDIIRL